MARAGQTAEVEFIRGDVNGDGEVTISDAVFLNAFQFVGPPASWPQCMASGDLDDNGTMELNDVVKTLDALYDCHGEFEIQNTIYEFGLNSSPVMKSKITFDSYPENIFLGDINNDSVLEVLVSGIGFDGLSILMRREGRLAENKIIRTTAEYF